MNAEVSNPQKDFEWNWSCTCCSRKLAWQPDITKHLEGKNITGWLLTQCKIWNYESHQISQKNWFGTFKIYHHCKTFWPSFQNCPFLSETTIRFHDSTRLRYKVFLTCAKSLHRILGCWVEDANQANRRQFFKCLYREKIFCLMPSSVTYWTHFHHLVTLVKPFSLCTVYVLSWNSVQH